MRPLFLFAALNIAVPALLAVPAEEAPSAVDLFSAQATSLQKENLLVKPVTADEVKKLVNAGQKISLADTVPVALKQNLGLLVTQTEHERVRESLEIADAQFDPTLTASSTYNNTGTPYLRSQSRGTYGHSWNNEIALNKKFQTGTTATIYSGFNRQYNTGTFVDPDSRASVGIEIAQPLLKGFGSEINLAAVARAQKNIDQSALNLRENTLDLIYNTEVAYWNLSANYALIFARLSSLRYAELVLEQTKKKRTLKSATKEDILRAEADVASRRVSLVSARQSVQDADDALRKILGQTGSESLEVYQVSSLLDDAGTPMPEFQSWIRQVRAFDIESRIRELEREKADIDIDVARDNDRANLDLILGAEASGRESSPRYAVGGVADRTGYNLSAGLRLSMPVGFRASRAALRQAVRSRESATLAIAQAEQSAMFNARAAWRAEEAARERLDAAKKSLSMQHEAFEAQIAKYNVGACSLTDVISAQDSLDSARLALIQAAYDVAVTRSKVHRLDGRILSDYGFIWQE
ncbi:MAG: TolC family protein [Opitutales bacterium]|nr:TolC family protein [Opitutales bacterium]